MSDKANINANILNWAIGRSQFSISFIAGKLGQSEEKLANWEKGAEKPSFNQALKLAGLLKIPFGYFFLASPPADSLPIPDLRTIADKDLASPSPDLKDIIKQVIRKQSWYIDYLKEHGHAELEFVGKFNTSSKIHEVVKDIKDTISVSDPFSGSSDEYFSALISAIEASGILVMRAGIVGSNTRRKLLVDEFRGFAIADSLCPVIFINSSDAPAARLFTLIHELAHVWIGSSGVSSLTTKEKRLEEIFCNSVAGEFLVPAERLKSLWQNKLTLDVNLTAATKEFHVSKIAAARKALHENLLTDAQYWKIYNNERKLFQDKSKKSEGGNFYNSALVKNSRIFSRAVVTEALRGNLLIRDAGALLDIPPAKIGEYARKLH